MRALSTADAEQPLRHVLDLGDDRLFGLMPGGLPSHQVFGAKLVSVFPDPSRPGRSRHRGIVQVYSLYNGSIICLADAEEITRIRTGCASAVATDMLARADSEVLAILGAGAQAESHLRALASIRQFRKVVIWARNPASANELSRRMSSDLDLDIEVMHDAEKAVEQADVICTVSSAVDPILKGKWVKPGTHLNIVGSSFLGPVEVDTELVRLACYFGDYRPSIFAQASEFDVARKEGAIDDTHLRAEIGEVIAGVSSGRTHSDEITVYKSLGHVVQDIAAASYVHEKATIESGAGI